MDTLFLTKEARIYNGAKTASSTNGAGKTGQLHVKGELPLEAQMIKCLPTMQETQVRSLGQEDQLEKEIATHSSTCAWKIPWTEERGRLQSMGSQRVRHD